MVKKTGKLPSAGDVFAFGLDNGMYGACRVLRFHEKDPDDKWGCDAVLVACCDWIGESIPDPNTSDLTAILQLTHHRWDAACVNWCTTPVTDAFTRVGAIEPSAAELTRACDSTTKWSFLPIQRLSQWVWDRDLEKD